MDDDGADNQPDLNRAVSLQRICSVVMLLASAATALVSDEWIFFAAGVAYAVSLVATWMSQRWGGTVWAVSSAIGFLFWAKFQAVQ